MCFSRVVIVTHSSRGEEGREERSLDKVMIFNTEDDVGETELDTFVFVAYQ